MTDQKPSEKILKNSIDGKLITDSLGRTILLRKPKLLDRFDLMGAMGKKSDVDGCAGIATAIIHVAKINDLVIECPKNEPDLRWAIDKLANEGLDAVIKAINESSDLNEEEALDKVKK